MSMFTETNDDATTGSMEGASRGPHLGFGEAFSAAYDAQAQGNSVLAVSTAFEKAEAEQARKIEALGGKAPRLNQADTLAEKQARGFDPYGDVARTLADGGDERTTALLNKADAGLEALRAQYPDAGIKSYREMFDGVKQSAQDAEKRWSGAQTTTLGSVGGFLGGAVASLDPRTDPYNFATLPLAGGGASVAGRIAAQAGIQGATEAVNQFSGVQDNRKLLGLKDESAAGSIAASAVGGALFQGAGEGLAAGAKKLFPRWFRDVPGDPAPPVPAPEAPRLPLSEPAAAPRLIDGVPEDQFLHSIARTNFDAFNTLLERDRAANPDVLGATRIGRARSVLDLDHVGATLDDWRGPLPSDVRASTAGTPDAPERYTFDIAGPDSVDARARAVDPDTFTLFDRVKTQAESFRQQIAAADDRAVAANRGALDTVEATLAAKQDQLSRARSAKTQDRLNAEIADLAQQRDGLARDPGSTSAELRAELVKIDEQMRDLAPVVSRAYAAAKGALSAEADSDAARFLRDLARSAPRIFPETERAAAAMEQARPAPPLPPRTVVDEVPIIASRPAATADLGPKADAADKLAAVMKQVEAERDTSTDAFRASIAKVIDPERLPDLPSVPPGHVRMFHGGSAPRPGETRWTNPAFEYARDYRRGDAPNEVFYVDVPENHPALQRAIPAEDLPHVGGQKAQRYLNSELPADLAVKMQAVTPPDVLRLPSGKTLHLDNDRVPSLDGTREVTVREYLDEIRQDEEALQGVSTCARAK